MSDVESVLFREKGKMNDDVEWMMTDDCDDEDPLKGSSHYGASLPSRRGNRTETCRTSSTFRYVLSFASVLRVQLCQMNGAAHDNTFHFNSGVSFQRVSQSPLRSLQPSPPPPPSPTVSPFQNLPTVEPFVNRSSRTLPSVCFCLVVCWCWVMAALLARPARNRASRARDFGDVFFRPGSLDNAVGRGDSGVPCPVPLGGQSAGVLLRYQVGLGN